MKKLAFILLAMVCGGLTILAQSPGLFNYQAVVRNSSGDLITNSDINFRISIREGSSQGTTVFSETQLVQSNSNGVCNLKIGDGNNITGSLSAIDWSSGTYFLQIETDASGGESFTETGTVQLLSVPYAMYANAVSNTDDADADSTNEIQDLNLDNNILTITGNPDATSISLAAYQGANTDNQELNLTGTDLSITGGNLIDVSSLVNDADADPTNELQNLTFSGDTLGLENGNHIIFPYDSSRWAINGQAIYYNTGNVGIGSSTPRSKLEVKADASFTVDDTLFSVKDKDGNIVFAVFPDGAKVYVNEGVKGRVGGFAVTGRNPTKAPLTEEEYLRVTPDSTRIWVTEDPTKARVGGFAVTGRNPTKGMSGDYLVVTSDSTRIYINDTTTTKHRVGGFAVTGRNPTKGPNDDYLTVTKDSTRIYFTESQTKGNVGGFAVTGRNPTKGDNNPVFVSNTDSTRIYTRDSIGGFGVKDTESGNSTSYMKLTPINYLIGHGSGELIKQDPLNDENGKHNMFFGYQAGKLAEYSYQNLFMGYQAGYHMSTGAWNVFIGNNAGYMANNALSNIFIGKEAGYNFTSGLHNIYIGTEAGREVNTSVYSNIYIGNNTGKNNNEGNYNTFVGSHAGFNNTGDDNTFLGNNCGFSNTGEHNVFLGSESGIYTGSGSKNICIGYRAGYRTTGTGNVFIGNSANNTNFSTVSYSNSIAIGDSVIVSGSNEIRIGNDNATSLYCSAPYESFVSGGIALYINSSGKIGTNNSSERYKKDIVNMESIDWLYNLRPVNFIYKEDSLNVMQYGLIAEEVNDVNPLFVNYNKNNQIETVYYNKLITPMLKAIQEHEEKNKQQQSQIDQLQKENEELKQKLNDIIEMLKKE